MNIAEIARLMDGIGTRRAVLAAGLAALAPAIGSGLAEAAGTKRSKRRRQRRRRRGGNGAGEASCDVCASGCLYPSIQAAIANPPPEGLIRVCPGVYRGPLTIGTTSLVFGRLTFETTHSPQDTTIDADGEGPAITVDPDVLAEFDGFTITGGKAAFGGGSSTAGS